MTIVVGRGLERSPDKEGIETLSLALTAAALQLERSPDKEGIETTRCRGLRL